MIINVCIALLGLLVIGGGFYVSLCRSKDNIIQGYPDDPSHYLHKAVRAHGNTVEFAPMIAILIYVISQLSPPTWIIACIVAITLARFSIFFGLLMSPTIAKPQPLRFMGALCTYVFGVILCGFLLVRTL